MQETLKMITDTFRIADEIPSPGNAMQAKQLLRSIRNTQAWTANLSLEAKDMEDDLTLATFNFPTALFPFDPYDK